MKRIIVGQGSCGIAAGAGKVYNALKSISLPDDVKPGITGCIGMCYLEPIVDIYDDKTLIARLVHVSGVHSNIAVFRFFTQPYLVVNQL